MKFFLSLLVIITFSCGTLSRIQGDQSVVLIYPHQTDILIYNPNNERVDQDKLLSDFPGEFRSHYLSIGDNIEDFLDFGFHVESRRQLSVNGEESIILENDFTFPEISYELNDRVLLSFNIKTKEGVIQNIEVETDNTFTMRKRQAYYCLIAIKELSVVSFNNPGLLEETDFFDNFKISNENTYSINIGDNEEALNSLPDDFCIVNSWVEDGNEVSVKRFKSYLFDPFSDRFEQSLIVYLDVYVIDGVVGYFKVMRAYI